MLENIKGHLDFILSRHATFYPWGGAMNGQTARLETCRRILTQHTVHRIVETGTFRGTTTEWFAQFGKPVVTIESSIRYARFSRLRLQKFSNVTVIKGDSVEALKVLLEDASYSTETVFFYLDAHWESHLPLAEELHLITNKCQSSVVLVDDFKVPTDDGYGHDDYGPSGQLTVDYLRANGLGSLAAFFPTTPSQDETGVRRGYVFLTGDGSVAKRLDMLPSLRRARILP
jgi:hypothetical protein